MFNGTSIWHCVSVDAVCRMQDFFVELEKVERMRMKIVSLSINRSTRTGKELPLFHGKQQAQSR